MNSLCGKQIMFQQLLGSTTSNVWRLTAMLTANKMGSNERPDRRRSSSIGGTTWACCELTIMLFIRSQLATKVVAAADFGKSTAAIALTVAASGDGQSPDAPRVDMRMDDDRNGGSAGGDRADGGCWARRIPRMLSTVIATAVDDDAAASGRSACSVYSEGQRRTSGRQQAVRYDQAFRGHVGRESCWGSCGYDTD